ncbi:MAG: 3-deoxy-D-manno-octulosonic acid transferase [Candidatus Omnitrophica bacterium]|nr:3-deoxy-D-manno-octulosonic acid transferase [Candidatus Omnitrophota bacterium]
MFVWYDLIFLIFILICLPVYLWKGKFHRGFLARLGVLPGNLLLDRPIWVHAVSVGEAKSIRGLVEELRKIYPAKKFVFSTVTPTGNKIVLDLKKPGDLVTYLPLDLSFIVNSVIKRMNPFLFIIAETEIWPNLIACLYQENIPIVTVNARISDASFKGYSAIKFLIKPVLNRISLFCCQTEADAAKLEQLGVAPVKIKVTGNMKFDQLVPIQASGYREKLGLGPDDRLFIAGSTHEGEEEIILSVYKSLVDNFPSLKLLIAPRHPRRLAHLLKTISKFGFNGREISKLDSRNLSGITHPVFVLDSVGELANFYTAADAVFVGGSLIKKGGHNILEPASLGKPVIFGPHMFNFRDIAEMFLKDNAAIMIKDGNDLLSAVTRILRDSSLVVQLKANALSVIAKNQGATKKNSQALGALGLADGN